MLRDEELEFMMMMGDEQQPESGNAKKPARNFGGSKPIRLKKIDINVDSKNVKSYKKAVTCSGPRKLSADRCMLQKRMSVIGNNKFGRSEIHSVGPAKILDLTGYPYEKLCRPSVPQTPQSPPPRLSPSGSELFVEQPQKRALYLFFQHGELGNINHSLYTVEIPSHPFPPIPSPESLKSQIDNPTPIHPTLLFDTTYFQSGMRCVQLGSKLYFLGGQTHMDIESAKKFQHSLKGNQWERYHPYPPNVYIFDTATITITITNANAFDFVTLGPSMNTGKPNPLLLFVAYGKIYALCSPYEQLDSPALEYFEVFDPITSNWAPLPPPPFREPLNMEHTVVKWKVYIMGGRHSSSFGFALHCFDLDKKEWIPSSKLKCPGLNLRYSIGDFVKDTLFGLFNGCMVAFGPVKDTDEDGDGQFFNRSMRFLQEGPLNSCMVCPMMLDYAGFLIHLGNKQFCYVASGYPPLHEDPLPEDPLYISLTIFESLIDTFTHEDGKTYSKAKFLHSAHFVAKTPWDADTAYPSDCFLAYTGWKQIMLDFDVGLFLN